MDDGCVFFVWLRKKFFFRTSCDGCVSHLVEGW